ncbi:aspartate aminotransferase family protein [Rhizobium grahamii]|uniref:Aspartate aminotransferase family protein n=1 Tax=Rhizobium grahamii TaxID=1120045 RepID=A0A5Q0C8L7_9HYPH|nr:MULTISPECIES: aminotransferase class V-fold PLP-dependent enzyme [Rhizobium]QFY60330.1 aspartate aminotransferase family protein [Rhizobium grahamii]QRM50543.1 aspartate aminotransferase family protein [Rhizobium sp. BG6]
MDNRELFSKAANHAARFRDHVAEGPQRPRTDYAGALADFSETLPEGATPAETVLDDLVTRAEPGLHAMTGPRFFGWVIGGSHPMGVAADILTSAWGQNTGNHTATPAAAAVETIASRWLLELLGLPLSCSVGFVTGATVANFTCLAAARGEVLMQAGWDADALGLFGAPPISILIGDDAHTTVFSALQFLGLGHDRVVRIATDEQGRIKPDAFGEAIAGVAGPCIAILQAGQINTGHCDDFAQLIPMAKTKGAWVHVDGAFGLWAQASARRRHLTDGAALADSWATDGHKWLQTPYDCGYAIIRNELAHRRAMTIAASYLPFAREGERDPSHYVPELSRRARGFSTWAMIRHLGRSGIEALVDRCCDAAQRIATALASEPGIAIGNSVVLNQAIVRFGTDLPAEQADALTTETIAELQRVGRIFAGGATWRGRQIMRLSVSNYQTDMSEAEKAAEAIISAYRAVRHG